MKPRSIGSKGLRRLGCGVKTVPKLPIIRELEVAEPHRPGADRAFGPETRGIGVTAKRTLFAVSLVVCSIAFSGAPLCADPPATNVPPRLEAGRPADPPGERHRIVTHAPGGPLLESPILSRLDYYRAVHEIAENRWPDAERLLAKTVEGDPSLVRGHLLLALTRLRLLEVNWILSMVDAAHALAGNFRAQSLLLANAVVFLFAIVSLLLLAGSATAAIRAIPAIRHGLVEALPPRLPIVPRLLYPVVFALSLGILFSPWRWGAGVVWLTAAGVLLAWRSLLRSEKTIAALFLVWLALTPVLLKVAVHATLPSIPGTTLFALSGTPDASLGEERAAGAFASSSEDEDILFTLALLERERGNRGIAMDLYGEILASGRELPAVYNNLGNLLFLRGDIDRALSCYRRALALDPKRATSHYNLGQLYLEVFSFDQARAEFSLASESDFSLIRSLSHAGEASGSRTLVDDSLPPSRLWGRFLSGESSIEGMTWFESFQLASGILLPAGRGGIFLLFLLLAASLLIGRLLPAGITCIRCGKTLCRKCRVRVAGTNRCHACVGAGMDRVWSPPSVLYHRPVSFSLGLLLPGMTHFYLGRRAKGLACAALALSIVLVWIFRGPIIKPFPVLHAANLGPLEDLTFVWLFVPLYLLVLLDALRLIRHTFREVAGDGRRS
jgi:tetratricopeptide (TPR) repeat protein